MSTKLRSILAAAAMVGFTGKAAANGERVYFKGSEEVARAGGGVVTGVPLGAAQVGAVQYQPPTPIVAAPPTAVLAAPTQAVRPGCLTCMPGSGAAKNYGAGIPNAIVTFLHPYTNKAVSVPMTLPVGKCSIITRSDRIIYDYGKFGLLGRYVVVRFYPDGGVMVKYH